MPLALSIDIEEPAWTVAIPDLEAMAETAVTASVALARPALLRQDRPVQIGLLFADDATLQALNRQFRHKDKPTNVLSFPANDAGPDIPELPKPVGDIAISFQTVAAEATRDGKTVGNHARHMIVHGVLHLMGHDHEAEDEAQAMESLETEILAGFGVPDPYIMWN